MRTKFKIIAIAAIFLTAGITIYSVNLNAKECATCSPKGKCNACKNCKYCQHCSKDGGSCSVCR